MAATEPALPFPVASNLLRARDIIVGCVDVWLRLWRSAPTIGHAGQVTQRYIFEQAGMGPRAIVTVASGTAERLAGGKRVQSLPTWTVFFATRGRIRDRTNDGLNLIGEAQRFVFSDPFGQVDNSIFCKPPQVGSLTYRNYYKDIDENTGYSIWAIAWRSEIALGHAGRAAPGSGPGGTGSGRLLEIIGTNVYQGLPNGDTVDWSLVGVPTAASATTAALGSAEAYIATATGIVLTISTADIVFGRDPFQFVLVAADAGGVDAQTIDDGGQYSTLTAAGGYVDAPDGDYPAAQISSTGSGRGATFTATLTGGTVTALVLDEPGSGYKANERIALLISGTASPIYAMLAAVVVVDAVRLITIDTEGGETIDGQPTATLSRPDERLVLEVTEGGNLVRRVS